MIDGKECTITVIRDDGKTFVFDQSRWLIPSDGLEGFGSVEYDVSTQDYAQYDGAALLNERIPTRDRSITAYPFFDYIEAREEATSFFIPRRAYEVHCTYMGRTRYFTGRQYAFDFTTGNVWKRPTLTWTCIALEPMWLSEDEKRFDLTMAAGKRGFSFCSYARRVSPTTEQPEKHIKGYIAGILSKEVKLSNLGHAEAYPRFEISATSEVVKPQIQVVSLSGEVVCSFDIDITLAGGDMLVVDFSMRPTAITLNGKNISHKITYGSTLTAGIPVGDFTVEWSAEVGDAALAVVPSIRERYTSI